jgi:hypothetical protein
MAYTLCTVMVDDLNIRAQPTSQSALVATYPRGTVLNFVEVVNGENVDGNPHCPRDAQRVRSKRAIKRAGGVHIDIYR